MVLMFELAVSLHIGFLVLNSTKNRLINPIIISQL